MRSMLLVEDDAVIRKVLHLALTRAFPSSTVLAVATGEEFLALLPRQQPALILLDLHLPDASGLALYHTVRRYDHLAQVPVLFVTLNPEQVQQAALDGPHAWLAKPFEVADLVTQIQALLMSSDTPSADWTKEGPREAPFEHSTLAENVG